MFEHVRIKVWWGECHMMDPCLIPCPSNQQPNRHTRHARTVPAARTRILRQVGVDVNVGQDAVPVGVIRTNAPRIAQRLSNGRVPAVYTPRDRCHGHASQCWHPRVENSLSRHAQVWVGMGRGESGCMMGEAKNTRVLTNCSSHTTKRRWDVPWH